MKIDILGSCVSRDVFRFDMQGKYEINKYFARTSLASLYSTPLDIRMDDIKLASDFQKRIVSYDCNKDFIRYVNQPPLCELNTYLIVDFIDERFNILEIKTEKINPVYITQSNEWNNAKIEQKTSKVSSSKKLDLWNNAVIRFAQDLKNKYSEDNIIIHRAFWKEKYIDKSGKIQWFENIDYIKTNNLELEYYYDTLQKLLPAAHIIEINDYIAYENHVWGLTYFHYQDEYYSKFLTILDKIILGKSTGDIVSLKDDLSEIYKLYEDMKRQNEENMHKLSKIEKEYNALANSKLGRIQVGFWKMRSRKK